jgi:hypothetical protein
MATAQQTALIERDEGVVVGNCAVVGEEKKCA